jgi:hypothetical protein
MLFFKKNKKDIEYYYQKCLQLLDERIDPRELPNFHEYRSIKEITFKSPEMDNMKRVIPLSTLKRKLALTNGDYIWEANYDEYVKVYKKDESAETIRKYLKPSLLLLKEKKNNEFFQYTISKYELSIVAVYETLKESIDFNGCVPAELKKEILKILLTFSSSIQKCEKEKDNHIQRDKSSFNVSLVNRLKMENEFIKKYIK